MNIRKPGRCRRPQQPDLFDGRGRGPVLDEMQPGDSVLVQLLGNDGGKMFEGQCVPGHG